MSNYQLDETDTQIIKLWKDGYTGSQIGKVVCITRNAVMGRIFRLRKAGVDVDSRTIETTRRYEEVKKNYRKPRPAPEDRPKEVGVSFFRLVPGSCKYVLNDGHASSFIFCGIPADMGAYCKEHHSICYVPPEPKRSRRNSYQKLTIAIGKKFYDDPA